MVQVGAIGEIEKHRKAELIEFFWTGDMPVEVQTAIVEFTGSLVLRSQRVCRICGESAAFDIEKPEAEEIILQVEQQLEQTPSGKKTKKLRRKLRNVIEQLERAVYCHAHTGGLKYEGRKWTYDCCGLRKGNPGCTQVQEHLFDDQFVCEEGPNGDDDSSENTGPQALMNDQNEITIFFRRHGSGSDEWNFEIDFDTFPGLWNVTNVGEYGQGSEFGVQEGWIVRKVNGERVCWKVQKDAKFLLKRGKAHSITFWNPDGFDPRFSFKLSGCNTDLAPPCLNGIYHETCQLNAEMPVFKHENEDACIFFYDERPKKNKFGWSIYAYDAGLCTQSADIYGSWMEVGQFPPYYEYEETLNANICLQPTAPEKYLLYSRNALEKMSERRFERYLNYVGLVGFGMTREEKVEMILKLVKNKVPTEADELRAYLSSMNLPTTGTPKQLRQRLIKALRQEINQTAV